MEFTCKVIKGRGKGKKIGFPTFNLQIPQDLPLKHGIYASWVWIKDKKYPGALHYGPIPVFKDPAPSLEVFIINYSSHQQVNNLTIQPLKFIRSIKNFSSLKALKSQITQDVTNTKKVLGQLEQLGQLEI